MAGIYWPLRGRGLAAVAVAAALARFHILDLLLLLALGAVTICKSKMLTSPPLKGLFLTLSLHVRRPEGEVVPEQLHDEGGVLVALL